MMVKISRRNLLLAGTSIAGGTLLSSNWLRAAPATAPSQTGSIDRRAVAQRNNPLVQKIDPFSAMTIGNGSFAFTADVTGLQTFNEDYRKDFPLCTCAHWAWHTTPAAPGIQESDYKFKNYNSHGRLVGYATDARGQEALYDWLRKNPHRMHLGRIGLLLKQSNGTPAAARDITAIHQTLDLWSGVLDSQFRFVDQPVHVQTCCHPEIDALAVRIESPLLTDGRLAVQISFPYPSPEVDMADWNSPDKHETLFVAKERADFARIIDGDEYVACLEGDGSIKQTAKHEFVLSGAGSTRLIFTVAFSQHALPALPAVADTFKAAEAQWNTFWSTGGAIDLAGSIDPRAQELERRIVLSQYNTAIHCAGPMPPQETGLLFNSWYGKSHLEMHWWHGAHFATWGRLPLLERSLDYYQRVMPIAKQTAVRQGYEGVRWQKMVGPEGRDSPSPIAPLLIWQQPHPIYYAELCYRARPTRQTLDQWQQIVFETANFKASFPALVNDRYVLGPPLKSVPEHTDTMSTSNPAFELAYWRFGLKTAQLWRQRLGMSPDSKWDDVIARLSPLPQNDGVYLMMEGQTDTYTTWNWEHPSVLGICGVLNGDGVNIETMRATLKKVMEVWQWDKCWGWDFPMTAMTAARLGEGEIAVGALMIDSEKNLYHPNGHVYQRPGLTAYLPANGGLLAATAMMATQPGGFPRDGKWSVRSEGLLPLL